MAQRLAVVGLILAASVSAAHGQSFEVATVKAGAPVPIGENININLGTVRNGTLTLTNATLSDCLKFAYELTSDSQIAGPDWIRNKEQRYDVVAKAAQDTPRDQILRMLQTLLIERLKIGMHREPREMNYYAFVPSKKGVKIQPSSETGSGANDRNAGGHIVRRQISMTMLATLIARFELHSVVLDMTGLKGNYTVDLEWTPAIRNASASNTNTNLDTPTGPSIFTAVQEQLGLRLESRKGPVDVLVIDHAEKIPAEN
jgi:uncharacterized protein (TIGR03435 family)